jgi:hypothetical protein
MSENKKDTNPPVGVPRQVVLTYCWLFPGSVLLYILSE